MLPHARQPFEIEKNGTRGKTPVSPGTSIHSGIPVQTLHHSFRDFRNLGGTCHASCIVTRNVSTGILGNRRLPLALYCVLREHYEAHTRIFRSSVKSAAVVSTETIRTPIHSTMAFGLGLSCRPIQGASPWRFRHVRSRTPTLQAVQRHLSTVCNPNVPLLGHRNNRIRNPNSDRRQGRWNSSTSSNGDTFISPHRPLVDNQEVHKFSAMSDTWWDAEQNPLLAMNAARMQFITQSVAKYRRHHPDPERQREQCIETPGGSQNHTQTTLQSNDHQHNQTTTGTLNNVLSPLAGYTSLDIGCGGGLLSESLARLGANTIGIDPSTALVAAAEQHVQLYQGRAPQNSLPLRYMGGLTLQDYIIAAGNNNNQSTPTVSKQEIHNPAAAHAAATTALPTIFDIVCCLEVLEHVPDPAALLKTIGPLIKPDTGLLFLSTINRTIASYCATILGAEYVLRLLPVGTHDWSSYMSPNEVQRMLEPHSVYPVETVGLIPPSLPSIVQSVGFNASFQRKGPRHVAASWKWTLDPQDTNVNWIACYQRRHTPSKDRCG